MSKLTPTFLLTKKTGWYGAHSGYYERVSAHLEYRQDIRIIRPQKLNLWRKSIGRLHSHFLKTPPRDQAGSYAEIRLRLGLLAQRSRGLILNLDDHTPFLRWWHKAPRRLVGVIHIPPSIWSEQRKSDVSRLSSAILPWSSALDDVEKLIGKNRVRFVPHGVNADFFRPGKTPRENEHLLCCGQFLRDFKKTRQTFLSLRRKRPNLRLTIVVAPNAISHPDLSWCAATPGVTLTSGLDDTELLRLYQRCTALLLPLKDSGANNAIVEALACGLPIATNDIGGIRDYGGGSIYPLASNTDDLSLTSIVESYLDSRELTHTISSQQRAFAEGITWEKVLPMIEDAMDALTSE